MSRWSWDFAEWTIPMSYIENVVCKMASILSRPQWVNACHAICILRVMVSVTLLSTWWYGAFMGPEHLWPSWWHGAAGPTFIKPDQLDPWIKDQIKITLLPTISHLLLPNFVSCGRACPSHMTQNLVTVGAKLWTAERFLVDPWSMDYADPVW